MRVSYEYVVVGRGGLEVGLRMVWGGLDGILSSFLFPLYSPVSLNLSDGVCLVQSGE